MDSEGQAKNAALPSRMKTPSVFASATAARQAAAMSGRHCSMAASQTEPLIMNIPLFQT